MFKLNKFSNQRKLIKDKLFNYKNTTNIQNYFNNSNNKNLLQIKQFSSLNNNNFLNGSTANYTEQMYEAWKQDPNSVHVSWRAFFTNLDNGQGDMSFISPPTLTPNSNNNQNTNSFEENDALNIMLLIRAYQKYGYLKSTIDPLKMFQKEDKFAIFKNAERINYKNQGFKDSDLDKYFSVNIKNDYSQGISKEKKPMKLKDIINRLDKAYCGDIGVEFKHVSSREEIKFIHNKMENEWVNYTMSKEEKLALYKSLAKAVLFEQFLDVKFTTKRFGLEGLETLITGLDTFFDESSKKGVKDITLGMAHRGRLNVLSNVFKKPNSTIFQEFMGRKVNTQDEELIRTGDVKYHLGHSEEKIYEDGRKLSMEILANPSHLECVNPVVQGKVRAKQDFYQDESKVKFTGITIHGDAALSGQGVNYETMQMNLLRNYATGGILHIVSNNQIGFTTTPEDGRSTPFSTDIGKSFECPIIHVNADNPIAVDFAFKMAAEFSQKYPQDIVIDIIGYRRHGHNEQDQPTFTQPEMYKKIKSRKDVLSLFEERLINEGFDKSELENIKKEIKDKQIRDLDLANQEKSIQRPKKLNQWSGYTPDLYYNEQLTGVDKNMLKVLGEKICFVPEDFNIHKTLKAIYNKRLESIKNEKGIDWPTAEALAWSVLLSEGQTVRISGQDVERGTFSHRHSVLHDQNSFSKYIPLHNICVDKRHFQPCLSHLSEFAVLGFETGYSYFGPNSLVMWEAQFGDFSNGAQTIIDQFISSGESKWNESSGIVLLLPHGMDGLGPEHSSCRIERYLQLVDDSPTDIQGMNLDGNRPMQVQKSNMQICNPSTPSNYFHVLLRQQRRLFRKPLVIPTPKKLLRHPSCISDLNDFKEGTMFEKVLQERNPDVLKNAKNVKNILLCSGQVYYDLIKEREALKRNDIAILTLEQIAPMPYRMLKEAFEKFPNAKVNWVQEEHMNSGGWSYVEPRLIMVSIYIYLYFVFIIFIIYSY